MGGCTSTSTSGDHKGILPKKKKTSENPTDNNNPVYSPAAKTNNAAIPASSSPSMSPLTSVPIPHNHVSPQVSRADSTLGQRRSRSNRASLGSYAQEDKIELIFKGKRNNIYQPGISAEERANFREKKVEKTPQEANLIRSALDQNFCFASLDDHDKQRLSDAMAKIQVNAGDDLIRQGDNGDYFYVIETGVFVIIVNGTQVAELHPGRSFGELSLMFCTPRAATVRAVTTSLVYALDRDTFRMVLANGHIQKNKDISDGLNKVPLLAGLTEAQIAKITDIVEMLPFPAGDVIIKKGTEGNVFYMVKEGTVLVSDIGDGRTYPDHKLGPGEYFGERALITGDPRAANIVAVTNVVLMAIDRVSFNSLLGPLKEVLNQNMILRVLNSIRWFDTINSRGKLQISKAFELEVMGEGVTVVREGVKGAKFFILNDGLAKSTSTGVHSGKSNSGATTPTRPVALNVFFQHHLSTHAIITSPQSTSSMSSIPSLPLTHMHTNPHTHTPAPANVPVSSELSSGMYFGEMALIDDEVNRNTVVTTTESEFFTLTREQFDLVMTQVQGGKFDNSGKLFLNESEVLEPLKQYKFNDLEAIAMLGSGTFGRVTLVRERTTKAIYALKTMLKTEIVAHKQQNNVLNERNIMISCNHPFILRLYQTFRDARKLYMLLEFVQGGELFSVVHTASTDGIPDAQAKFYAVGIILALGYLHKKDIAYRDLKPENCLIDSAGYPKLIDFGFAKTLVGSAKTYTLCGTPEYLAPELVLGRGHNRAVDYWALGILVYEMQAGFSPFSDAQGMDQVVICRNIVNGRLSFPRSFNIDCKDLCKRLLVREIQNRLGNQRGGVEDVVKHSWFRSLDFYAYMQKRLKAPWMPVLKSVTDSTHFDPVGIAEHANDGPIDPGTWDKNF